ncbi:hypothetical protein [Paenibacillus sp. PAMC 26794]|uniref:hypothetical protein n=1 Tax=Paenibacillus sp. PAMC 26794 TaxID=1257080 RepID=UPI0003616C83|nr:hypothetical protein [Paenibacillus sp. PAMC 26794]
MIDSMLERWMQEELTAFVRATYGTPFLIRRIGTLFPDEHLLTGECSSGKKLTTNNKSLMVMCIYHYI